MSKVNSDIYEEEEFLLIIHFLQLQKSLNALSIIFWCGGNVAIDNVIIAFDTIMFKGIIRVHDISKW